MEELKPPVHMMGDESGLLAKGVEQNLLKFLVLVRSIVSHHPSFHLDALELRPTIAAVRSHPAKLDPALAVISAAWVVTTQVHKITSLDAFGKRISVSALLKESKNCTLAGSKQICS